MLAKAIAVPVNVHDVALMDAPVDQRGRHDLVAKDLAPVLRRTIRGKAMTVHTSTLAQP